MKTYESYKESGINWIGKIPEHWEIKKMKWITSIKRGASPRPIADPKYFDDEKGEFSWVRIADVSASERYLLETKEKLSELGASLSVKRYPGDFFLSIAGSVGKPIITKIKCCIHDGFVWFPELKLNPEFLYYIFQSDLPFGGLGKVGTQLNLNTETIGNIQIPYISDEDVTSIVNYLDHKTQIIDGLIEKKEQLIKKLQAQRQAIINEAVTKGLNPNAKLKDSGIEWLGEYNSNWSIKRIKHITYVKGRIGWQGLKSEDFREVGPYLVTGTDFNKGKIKWDTCHRVDYDRYEVDENIQLLDDDVLITKDGTIGKIAIVKNKPEKVTLNSGVFVTRPLNKDYLQDYFFWLLSSDVFNLFIDFNKSGATIQHLYQNVFNEFSFALPTDLGEQQEIVNHLDLKTNKMDLLIDKIKLQIKKLKAYRQSIISEAVTGKIDVREWQATSKN
ncbi:restriction endonuclease subunit S [Lacinutrix himadriensis]|uniref:restriction endonuclease subunit S n=1 Tax=Lacinutrix himadriensis TaxID=641549 RepID=UPI0006E23E81|nr:restriction endonuclease subunit S [Lacinutrix himadriensis]